MILKHWRFSVGGCKVGQLQQIRSVRYNQSKSRSAESRSPVSATKQRRVHHSHKYRLKCTTTTPTPYIHRRSRTQSVPGFRTPIENAPGQTATTQQTVLCNCNYYVRNPIRRCQLAVGDINVTQSGFIASGHHHSAVCGIGVDVFVAEAASADPPTTTDSQALYTCTSVRPCSINTLYYYY